MQQQGTIPAEPHVSAPAPTSRFHGMLHLANRSLVPFALGAVALAAAMLVGLHLLPGWGGVNPVTGMLSDYGVRPMGWVFDTALDILSVGSIAVVVKMARHGVLRGGPSFVLMTSWCVCLVGIAIFTKDPNSGAQTVRGTVHLWVTAAACASLPIASMVIGWRHRRDPHWRRWAWTSQGLALVCLPCGLPFVVSFFVIRLAHVSGPSSLPTGLVERLMGGVDVLIIVVLALWAHRAASTRRQRAVAG